MPEFDTWNAKANNNYNDIQTAVHIKSQVLVHVAYSVGFHSTWTCSVIVYISWIDAFCYGHRSYFNISYERFSRV